MTFPDNGYVLNCPDGTALWFADSVPRAEAMRIARQRILNEGRDFTAEARAVTDLFTRGGRKRKESAK